MYKKIYQKLAGKGLGRFFPTNYFAKKAVRNMTGVVEASVQGFKMIVPIEQDHGMVLYLKHIYEPVVTKYIKMFLHPKETFVDVGACLGYYSLLASNIVGPKGRVLAFEPERKNYDYLAYNIVINEFTNILGLEKAASDKIGKANLNISENHIGCHSLHYSTLSGHKDRACIVDTIPIDQCIDRVDMVKIDVEGTEYQVLKGLESFFSKNDNSIMVFQEYCPSLLTAKMRIELMEFLERFAYCINIINEKKNRLDLTDAEKLPHLKERVNIVWWS